MGRESEETHHIFMIFPDDRKLLIQAGAGAIARAVCGMSQHLSKRPEQLFTARCAQMKGEVKGRKEVANKKTNQNRKLFGSSLVGGISIIA